MDLFFTSFLIGLGVALPFGPISLLCVQKTLAHGIRGACVVGLGACCAHGVFASIAFFGLSTWKLALLRYQRLLRILGSLFLLRIAYLEHNKSKPSLSSSQTEFSTQLYLLPFEVFALTLCNPITIMSFVSYMTSIQLPSLDPLQGFVALSGLCLGSLSWRIVLGSCTHILAQIDTKQLWLNKLQQYTTVAIALYAVWTLFKTFLVAATA